MLATWQARAWWFSKCEARRDAAMIMKQLSIEMRMKIDGRIFDDDPRLLNARQYSIYSTVLKRKAWLMFMQHERPPNTVLYYTPHILKRKITHVLLVFQTLRTMRRSWKMRTNGRLAHFTRVRNESAAFGTANEHVLYSTLDRWCWPYFVLYCSTVATAL